jgi:hypothetical protein
MTLVGNHSFVNLARVLVAALIGSCCFMILFAAFVVRIDTALKQQEEQLGEVAYDLVLRLDNTALKQQEQQEQQEQQLGELTSQLGELKTSQLGDFASQLSKVRQELLDHTRKEQPMAFTIFITTEYWKQGKTHNKNSHKYVISIS